MKRWRRPAILIAAVLLAGAVVNVAVAWGIAGTEPPIRISYEAGVDLEGGAWPVAVPVDWPQPLMRWDVVSRAGEGGARTRVWWHTDYRAEFGPSYVAIEYSAGWPALSLRRLHAAEHEWIAADGDESELTREAPIPTLLRGLAAPEPLARRLVNSDGHLPLAPILPGFILNTAFYAAILAAPLIVFPVRRWRRRQRGRCMRCGYEGGGLADNPCPECGGAPR